MEESYRRQFTRIWQSFRQRRHRVRWKRVFQSSGTAREGFGTDDLLDAVGHADLAAEVLLRVDTAIAIADTTTVSVQEGVLDDPTQIDTLYDAVQDVTTLLKTDLVTVLSIEVPPELSGDND